MHATSGTSDNVRVADAFPTLELTATSGQLVTIPDAAGKFVHLQLRRFAGCPICNQHLRSIVTRHDEIRSHGIQEVVVFHSTAAELAKHEAELPFPLIADPERELPAEHARAARGDRRPGRRAGEPQHQARRARTDQAHRRPVRAAGGFPDRSRRAGRRAQIRTARLRPVDGRRTPRPRPSRARVMRAPGVKRAQISGSKRDASGSAGGTDQEHWATGAPAPRS